MAAQAKPAGEPCSALWWRLVAPLREPGGALPLPLLFASVKCELCHVPPNMMCSGLMFLTTPTHR